MYGRLINLFTIKRMIVISVLMGKGYLIKIIMEDREDTELPIRIVNYAPINKNVSQKKQDVLYFILFIKNSLIILRNALRHPWQKGHPGGGKLWKELLVN